MSARERKVYLTLVLVFSSSVYHHGKEVISIDRWANGGTSFRFSERKIERLRRKVADKDDSLVSG